MDKKQLNLNAPLLSMRKTAANFLGASNGPNKKKVEKSGPLRQRSLPTNQPEWELSEVTKPGTVPFLWEQMPGRPKGEVSGETEPQKRSSSTPRLPPGWGADGSRRNSGERPVDYNTHKTSFEVYHLTDHAALIESLKASMYDNGKHDSEDENDVYSNAADTLSLEESLSINCSISGVSNLEVSSKKPSVSSNIEKQTKDFMMSRFLPAAKAVALETPQYAPKNKFAVSERSKQMNKAVHVERNPLLDNKSRSNLVLSDYQYAENVTSEAEDDKRDEHGKRSGKAWGFLPRIVPRLCVKKTLCMLNPVQGLKTKAQTPKSPANDISRLTRRKAYSGPLDKPAWDANDKKRFHSGALSGELRRLENKMQDPNQFSYSNAPRKPGGLSPFRTARSAGVSPYRNATPLSPFDKGAKFLGKPEEVECPSRVKYSSTFKEGSKPPAATSPVLQKKELVPANRIVEKRVSVDSVNSAKQVRVLASEYLKPVKSPNSEKWAESRRKEENSPRRSSSLEVKPLDIIKRETKAEPKSFVEQDALISSTACVSKLIDKMEGVKLEQGINNEVKYAEANNELKDKTDSSSAIMRSHLPPPLPKSPSESWLWKTVPSIPFRNPFTHSNQGSPFHLKKKAGEKPSALGVKWETIVKTSTLHHSHSRYSEELIPHISH